MFLIVSVNMKNKMKKERDKLLVIGVILKVEELTKWLSSGGG